LNGVPALGLMALYDAIDFRLAHLRKASREGKVLIVISDGGDNASRHNLSQISAVPERSDVPVYTIGLFNEFDADQNPGILRKLARATGGEAFLPGQLREVTPICEGITKEIRSQYTIAYAASNASLDNTYRKIRVTASRPHGRKVFVSTRDGYVAAPRKKDQAPLEFKR
jgi:Ca-activated chloride channel homolog